MKMAKRKKSKTLDLLQISDCERVKVIKQLKEDLRQKVVEAKLWRTLTDTENLTINGERIHHEESPLRGISINDLMRSH